MQRPKPEELKQSQISVIKQAVRKYRTGGFANEEDFKEYLYFNCWVQCSYGLTPSEYKLLVEMVSAVVNKNLGRT